MQSAHKIDPKDFSTTVRPTDDFFSYVNEQWIRNNPIPPEESRWGTFQILRLEVEKQLKELLEELIQKDAAPSGTNSQKIRDFYQTAMNTEMLNSLGLSPLSPLYETVGSVTELKDLCRVIGLLQKSAVGAWWTPIVAQDAKQSEVMALHLYQGGLSLPDRDYYTNDDEKSCEIREKYLSYVARMLVHTGTPAATSHVHAKLIMDIETSLARASMTQTELRDVEKLYNKMSLDELGALSPLLSWPAYFEAIGAPTQEYVIVGQPKFFEEVNRLFGSLSLEDIKVYLGWHVLNGMAQCLTEDLEQKSFDFYARTFKGATEMQPRWRRVLGTVSGLLDHALGQLYVERHFSEKAKQKINVLVDHITAAYRSRIEKLDWMTEGTREKALEKLSAISRKLGYPDKWKDFSALEIKTDSYAQNVIRAHTFEFERKIAQIGKPVDRGEWYMPPQTVNAFYSETKNEIGFPAAILQPPFFDPNADDALNFGGIGSVIAHELTHGFDDQGALFDKNGNMQNWWSEDDKKHFDAKTTSLKEQFDSYEPLPGVHINGKYTLGENTADLGGVAIALDALRLTRGRDAEVKLIDGLTEEQRFFVNWAVVWRMHEREEWLRTRLQTDVHSPELYRVNGPLSNTQAFYDAFGCKPGDKLWRDPEDRVKVW